MYAYVKLSIRAVKTFCSSYKLTMSTVTLNILCTLYSAKTFHYKKKKISYVHKKKFNEKRKSIDICAVTWKLLSWSYTICLESLKVTYNVIYFTIRFPNSITEKTYKNIYMTIHKRVWAPVGCCCAWVCGYWKYGNWFRRCIFWGRKCLF